MKYLQIPLLDMGNNFKELYSEVKDAPFYRFYSSLYVLRRLLIAIIVTFDNLVESFIPLRARAILYILVQLFPFIFK